MLKASIILLLLLSTACSRGYQGNKSRRSPEQLQLAEMAHQLSVQVEQLAQAAPSEVEATMKDYVDSASRFDNASQRFGADSLEARAAFDRFRFQSRVVAQALTQLPDPHYLERWKYIETHYIKEIATRLGYKVEKS